MRHPARHLVYALVPAAVLAVALLAGGEAWMRRRPLTWDPYALSTAPAVHADCYRLSPTVGYEPVPGACGRDARGFYRDAGGGDDPGALRVLVLGDSVADLRAWVRAMGQAMTERIAPRPVAVWNGGVPGYDTCTEVQTLRERGLSLAPDLVVLQVCPNDLAVAATVVPAGPGRVRFHVAAEYTEFPRWILQSRLLTFAFLKYGVFRSLESPRRGTETAMATCLADLADLGQRHGFGILVAHFPALSDAPDEPETTFLDYREARLTPWEAEERSRDLVARSGLPVFDVRGALTGHRLRDLRVAPDDPWHPGAEGQVLLGRALGEAVSDLASVRASGYPPHSPPSAGGT